MSRDTSPSHPEAPGAAPVRGAYAAAASLEEFLGDPMSASSRLSFAASVALDEAEAFPSESVASLDAWGLHRYFVPEAHGGKFVNAEENLYLLRSVSRRDLTTAIARFKTLLGALPVWISAESSEQGLKQAKALGSHVLAGEDVSLALTERQHGSDLVASDVTFSEAGDEYEVSGEKWLINNATRSRFISLLGREQGREGSAGLSLLLLDKQSIGTGLEALPKVRTLGIRGADISGLRFNGPRVPQAARIGRAGRGLDIVMRAMQVSRPICGGLSLGAGDTALRFATAFARERILYGKSAWEIDAARQLLVGAYLDLQAAEAVNILVCRGLHLFPERMSLWSSIAKYFVPVLVEGVIRDSATVLGARHYLRESFAAGAFQKMARDHSLVPLFDGSTQVNLNAISSLMPFALEPGVADKRTETLTRLGGDLPELSYGAFRFSAREPEPLFVPLAADPVWEPLRRDLLRHANTLSDSQSGTAFTAAHLFCVLFAAAAARAALPGSSHLIEHRLLAQFHGGMHKLSQGPDTKRLEEELERRSIEGASFGIIDLAKAR